MNKQTRIIVKVIGTHAAIIGGFAALGVVLHDLAKLRKAGVL